MDNLFSFNSINISVPKNKIYKRLGYREGITKISSRQQEELENHIETALSYIHLTGAGICLSLNKVHPSGIELDGGLRFESKNLTEWLKGCDEVLLMGATAGREIMDEIIKDTGGRNMTRGVVLDAVASEMVDGSLDWIMEFFNGQFSRENKYLTGKRFSAGYGDFELENQKKIYNALKLNRIGIEITSSFMLNPEKSVTALAGVKMRND